MKWEYCFEALSLHVALWDMCFQFNSGWINMPFPMPFFFCFSPSFPSCSAMCWAWFIGALFWVWTVPKFQSFWYKKWVRLFHHQVRENIKNWSDGQKYIPLEHYFNWQTRSEVHPICPKDSKELHMACRAKDQWLKGLHIIVVHHNLKERWKMK